MHIVPLPTQVREFGTNYPPSLYDPNELTKEEHYDRLEETRRKWEARQARKPGEKVGFNSAGVLDPGKNSASTTDEVKPRKSKWDTAGGSESTAKRPAV